MNIDISKIGDISEISNINNISIFYIFISILMFAMDKSIQSMTDTLEKKINKEEMAKYSFASLCIVLLYIIFFYFTTNTARFTLTTELGVALLVIYIFSFVYLNLNSKIATSLHSKPIHKNIKMSLWGTMAILNLAAFAIFMSTARLLVQDKSFIDTDTKAVIMLNNEEYAIVIPKDTRFTYDYIAPKNHNTSGANQLFNVVDSSSQYKLPKDSTIVLLKDSFLHYYRKGDSQTPSVDKQSIKLYLTDKSFVQLKDQQEVKLTEDTLVSLEKVNPYVYISAFHSAILPSMMMLYYLFCSLRQGVRNKKASIMRLIDCIKELFCK